MRKTSLTSIYSSSTTSSKTSTTQTRRQESLPWERTFQIWPGLTSNTDVTFGHADYIEELSISGAHRFTEVVCVSETITRRRASMIDAVDIEM